MFVITKSAAYCCSAGAAGYGVERRAWYADSVHPLATVISPLAVPCKFDQVVAGGSTVRYIRTIVVGELGPCGVGTGSGCSLEKVLNPVNT